MQEFNSWEYRKIQYSVALRTFGGELPEEDTTLSAIGKMKVNLMAAHEIFDGEPHILKDDDTDDFETSLEKYEKRKIRFRAADYFARLVIYHSEFVDSDMLDMFHAALFDKMASVASNMTIILGHLANESSEMPLREFVARMNEVPGWFDVVHTAKWALGRVLNEPSTKFEGESFIESMKFRKMIELGPDRLELYQDQSGRWILVNDGTQSEIELSMSEAANLYNSTNSRIQELYFSTLEDPDRKSSRLEKVAVGLGFRIPYDSSLVTLVDTTTIRSAHDACEGRLDPESISDLTTLIYCVIMYDQIVVDSSNINVHEMLKDIVAPIRNFEGSELDSRWSIAVNRDVELKRDSEFQAEIDSSWSDFLGRQVKISFDSFDSITDSPDVSGYFPGGLNAILLDPSTYEFNNSWKNISEDEISKFASVQTFRYFINEAIAAELGVSYNCTSLRYPVQCYSLWKRQQFRDAFDEVIGTLYPTGGLPAEKSCRSGFRKRVYFPNLLSVVLSRSQELSDIIPQAIELRKKFSPVRARLLRDRQLGKTDLDSVDEVIGAVCRRHSLPRNLDSVLAVGSTALGSLSTASPDGSVAVKLISSISPAKIGYWLWERYMRPEALVLRRFSAEVIKAAGAGSDFERLWGSNLDAGWLNRAAIVSRRNSVNYNRIGFA